MGSGWSDTIHVSARFRLTLEAAILELESGAAHDEGILSTISDPDHRRRQQLLIAAELDRAWRLRQLLGRVVVRAEGAA